MKSAKIIYLTVPTVTTVEAVTWYFTSKLLSDCRSTFFAIQNPTPNPIICQDLAMLHIYRVFFIQQLSISIYTGL